ncbi:MAG: Ig-like domain-containing protein [Bacteroidaceae bacterium]|nr:Ig-like domain-containing protein [Bacteroidaceae bacterium]
MKKNQLKCLLAVALLLVCGNVWGETVTDILDYAFTGISATGYEEWSGKTSNSTAVYAGQSAGQDSTIQLRSNNSNSGVVTTASGGTVKKVTVTWNSVTDSGRTLNVYGKSTAYTAATDLYNTSKQGTLIGTIVYGTSTELVITDEYQYIGFRSKSGAMYLDKVEIVWEKSTLPTTPSISFVTSSASIRAGETFTQTATVENAEGATVSYSSSNPEIATVDASGKVTGLTKGTVTITGTITVDGTDYSADYSVTVVAAEDGVFDFTWGYDYGSGIEAGAQISEPTTFTAGNVNLTTSGNFAWYTSNGTFRLYTGGSYTLTVPEGYVITGIAFTGTQNLTSVTVNSGEISGNGKAATWTGEAQNVTITRGASNPFYNTISVTYGEKSGAEVANLSIDATKLAVSGDGTPNTATISSDAEGLSVSYESSNASVATVSDAGVVTAVAAGTATITATWAEQMLAGTTYAAGSKEFNVTVYAIEDGKFDFTNMVITYGSGLTASNENEYVTNPSTWTAGNVTMTVAGKYRWWSNDGTLRLYDSNNAEAPTSVELSVPEGFIITNITITGGTALAANVGTYSSGKWAGASQSVVLSHNSTSSVNIKTITITYYSAPSVTISAAEWATACLPFDATIATEGVTAYYVSIAEGAISKTAVTGVIPAGEGVLLNGAAGAVSFNYSEASDDDKAAAANNQLAGSITGETFNEEGMKYYILANGNDGNGGGNGIGFYYQTEGGASATCSQYKAVLAVHADATESKGYRLDGTTMVEQMLQDDADVVIYDLTGRQVSSISGRGIYIINGKKVIVK